MDNSDSGRTISRRGMLGQVAGAVAAVPVVAPPAGSVNRNSAPSQLKITDIRACTVASNFDYPHITQDGTLRNALEDED